MGSKAVTRQLVKEYFHVESDRIPVTRETSEWTSENKCGFLLGLIDYGLDSHVSKLRTLLEKHQFKQQECVFIKLVYMFYIFPFILHNGTESLEPSCYTPE